MSDTKDLTKEKERIHKSIGSIVKRYRRKNRVTQKYFSQRVGISQSRLSKLELGKTGIDAATFIIILEVITRKN